ncbi:hypothetical protein DRQ20_07200 [bacterium]|nr:MAG: hypothetical protein DRQ20_07200 [bacterium]
MYLVWVPERVERRFGKEGKERLLKEMERVGWGIIEPDGIKKRAKPGDTVVLVGGDELFPFKKVENPTHDPDPYVYTDNLYASLDDDYLIPELALSRLPDGGSLDLLITLLRSIGKNEVGAESLGVTAAVWKEAALEVYKEVGKEEMVVSPPSEEKDLPSLKKEILYFNVHGSDTSPYWYGEGNGKYPVILSPRSIPDFSGVVASEACYGAYILDKKCDESIALTFLKKGAVSFLGSTTIAYGPYYPPSTEADLLVKLYFQELKNGKTCGEALLEAKRKFFKKTVEEQGYLDKDDEKTLLQFVLYGNPLGRLKWTLS